MNILKYRSVVTPLQYNVSPELHSQFWGYIEKFPEKVYNTPSSMDNFLLDFSSKEQCTQFPLLLNLHTLLEKSNLCQCIILSKGNFFLLLERVDCNTFSGLYYNVENTDYLVENKNLTKNPDNRYVLSNHFIPIVDSRVRNKNLDYYKVVSPHSYNSDSVGIYLDTSR